jgi:hypothetical protein
MKWTTSVVWILTVLVCLVVAVGIHVGWEWGKLSGLVQKSGTSLEGFGFGAIDGSNDAGQPQYNVPFTLNNIPLRMVYWANRLNGDATTGSIDPYTVGVDMRTTARTLNIVLFGSENANPNNFVGMSAAIPFTIDNLPSKLLNWVDRLNGNSAVGNTDPAAIAAELLYVSQLMTQTLNGTPNTAGGRYQPIPAPWAPPITQPQWTKQWQQSMWNNWQTETETTPPPAYPTTYSPVATPPPVSIVGLPSSIDLSQYMPPVQNQGQVTISQCFSWIYNIASYFDMMNANAQTPQPTSYYSSANTYNPYYIFIQTNTTFNPKWNCSNTSDPYVVGFETYFQQAQTGCLVYADYPIFQNQTATVINGQIVGCPVANTSTNYKFPFQDVEYDYIVTDNGKTVSLPTSTITATDYFRGLLAIGNPLSVHLMMYDSNLVNLASSSTGGTALSSNAIWVFDPSKVIYNSSSVIANGGDDSSENQYSTHEVTLVGYIDDVPAAKQIDGSTGVFIFRSSWGANWGTGGNGYITYNQMTSFGSSTCPVGRVILFVPTFNANFNTTPAPTTPAPTTPAPTTPAPTTPAPTTQSPLITTPASVSTTQALILTTPAPTNQVTTFYSQTTQAPI